MAKENNTEINFNEDMRRMSLRKSVREKNKILLERAKLSGVKNLGKFYNYGYRGLYNGEDAMLIAKRKHLHDGEDILDYMGSEELASNLFRIVQTEAKLRKEMISDEKASNLVHYFVGALIREMIRELGGTLPEDLPTPTKSVKLWEKEVVKNFSFWK